MDQGAAAHERCPAHSLSLRERKKAETREAIARAAVRLALERGPENVRVADIAAAADVSPRTYNNYFASIPEAIFALASDRALELADAVRGRPADEPLDEAVANAMLSVQDDGFGKPFVRMILHNPVLRGEFLKAIVVRDAALARVIAERTGTSPSDLYPQVLAAAISGAARVAGHRWLHDDDADFEELLRSALAIVAPMARTLTREPASSAQRKIARPDPAVSTRLQASG
jgi:AcrR family transcriptional regulator